jgi:hypothetical protein
MKTISTIVFLKHHLPKNKRKEIKKKYETKVLSIWKEACPRSVEQSVMECTVKTLHYVKSPVRNPSLPCVSRMGHRGHTWRL